MSRTSRGIPGTLRGGRLLIAILIAIGLIAGVGRALTGLYVEVLWHAEVGYLDVFWRRVVWEWGGRILSGLGVLAIVFAFLLRRAETGPGAHVGKHHGQHTEHGGERSHENRPEPCPARFHARESPRERGLLPLES